MKNRDPFERKRERSRINLPIGLAAQKISDSSFFSFFSLFSFLFFFLSVENLVNETKVMSTSTFAAAISLYLVTFLLRNIIHLHLIWKYLLFSIFFWSIIMFDCYFFIFILNNNILWLSDLHLLSHHQLTWKRNNFLFSSLCLWMCRPYFQIS